MDHRQPSIPGDSPRLLDALARLNHIGAAINRLGADPHSDLDETLRLIAESAIEVVGSDPLVAAAIPGRASTVIYTYDPAADRFDPRSRVSAGVLSQPIPGDEPRPAGMGILAVRQRRRLLSPDPNAAAGELALPGIHPALQAAGAQAMACYPLVVADQPVGVLYLFLHEQRPFGPLELLMLDNFVNQAAMAIYQAQQLARVRRDLERKEDELQRLRRADLLISSRLGLEETLETILHMALDVTGARYGIFRLVDRAHQALITRAIAGDDLGRPAVEALPIDATSITGWVAVHRQPLVIADVRADKWARLYYPLDLDLDMRSELAVPLIGAGGRLEGVLNLESPQIAAFSEDDSRLLQSLATQAVIAIQEVRLLDALQEISERLLTQPAGEVLDRVVELAADLLDLPVSLLWTLAGEELILAAAAGWQAERPPLPLAADAGALAGRAIRARALLFSPDVRAEAAFCAAEFAGAPDCTQALIVPLLAGGVGDPVGALSVYNTAARAGPFSASDWDKKVLTFLAHHAALAVQNAAHQQALQLARSQRAAAETFAAVGDIAANLLHRLNNKIGVIPVRVEGIAAKSAAALAADPYLAHNLAEIEGSAIEALEIMRDSLSHLRPAALGPVDVAACVAAALAETPRPAGVQVCANGLQALPPVLAGQRQLALVFQNLLENAVAALAGRGEIEISGAARGGWVEMVVRDNGPGIPPALHERIFEFNYSGARRASGKLGFGLWWVKTIMARFGGAVQVESDGRSGAAFHLRLPAARAEAI